MPAAKKQDTLGKLIDDLARKKQELKDHGEVEKRLKDEAEKIKLKIIAAAAEAGLGAATGKLAAAKIEEKVVPQAKDWDKVYALIAEKGWFHLLQRRLSTPGCIELFETQPGVLEAAGVERFTKIDVTLRNL